MSEKTRKQDRRTRYTRQTIKDTFLELLKQKSFTKITGKDIDIQADSVCVHGDGAKALAFVEKIREAFVKEGIQISPFNSCF